MYDTSNVFAKIIRGEIPAFKVYEDAQALSFMDAMPQSDGHTLVIPKVEARNFFDIAPGALADLIKATQHVARGVQQAFQPDGMRIIQFNEPAAGQTVFHIHFHILPCYEGVAIRGHNRDWADKALLAEHAERIRAALAFLPPRQ
ncbi:MAG: HIT family protein [Pseudomonadota bacterium]|nr:HIT family protein [Pseudomonadota bacterium]